MKPLMLHLVGFFAAIRGTTAMVSENPRTHHYETRYEVSNPHRTDFGSYTYTDHIAPLLSMLRSRLGGRHHESREFTIPSIANGTHNRKVGIRIFPSKSIKSIHGNGEYIFSIHDGIHNARQQAMQAKLESLISEFKINKIRSEEKRIKAEKKINEANQLKEEEKRLVSGIIQDPQVLVKDTIAVADVANNFLSFKGHEDLLRRRLEQINKYQNMLISQQKNRAILHKAYGRIIPDNFGKLRTLYKQFVERGPARQLTYEVPVDPSIGKFSVSTKNLHTSITY
ncbi:hypothetical protein HK407_01g02430 [Ordospora pajunii]|uniref:uncharacterized protein n=1 Tax=Ordospora pajunii TaxID=3039483 RepID=UPI0029527A39|nr:uncharacterized protein HK407_01g02430 [Ordospora pajunii]KAH9412348.1 hypothetical protein HK407_01g02430 [Ordospora pajunii]